MHGEGEHGRPGDNKVGQTPLRAFLALAAACGFGVAQPLYDLLARHPTLLVAHQLTWIDMLQLATLLSLGLPLALWITVLAWGWIDGSSGRYLQGAWVGLALALVPLQALRHWPASGAARLALLGVLAITLGLAYLRSSPLRRLLGLLAAGALVFPVLFLTKPEIGSLGRKAEGPATEIDVRRPAPVVILVLDELPMSSLLTSDGEIYAERFPNFDRLRRISRWFPNATSVAHNTAHAVPAILTGRYPDGGPKTPDLQGYPETLLTILEGSYNLNVIESATDLCGDLCDDSMDVLTRRERWGPALADISAVFAALVLADAGPTVDSAWSGFWDEPAPSSSTKGRKEHWKWRDPPRRYQRFEGRVEAFPQRTLHFLHLMLPHRPWQFLPSGKAYLRRDSTPHGLLKGRLWIGGEWELLQAQQRHLLQVQYVDTLLGQLLDTLERNDQLDQSLLIVTADHGCTFRSRDSRRSVTATNLIDLAHVPLMVKLPGQATGTTDSRNVQTIDIVPTVADVLGFDIPWQVDGVSLLSKAPRPSEKRIYRSLKDIGAGEPLIFSLDRMAESREVVEQTATRFPESDLFVVGPGATDRALLGTPVGVRLGPAAPARAEVRRLNDYDGIDLEDWWLPSHIMGTLHLAQPTHSQVRLAIALDGTVRAVTETYGRTPATTVQFTALLDPRLFVAGARHALELFLLEADGRDSILQPITIGPKE